MQVPPRPVELFFSYAQEDEPLRERLERHLSVLQSEGLIRSFHAGQVSAGEASQELTEAALGRAEVIMLLISADFLASHRCKVETGMALTRQRAGQAVVIPILLRACDWLHSPFGGLQALPRDKRPVQSWDDDEDEALAEVARGIREVVSRVIAARAPATAQPRPMRASRAELVKLVLQWLGETECVGVALFTPLGFEGHQVAGDVLARLHRPNEPLLPVRLVPERHSTSEDGFYERLLRDLGWGLPAAWRTVVQGGAARSAMDRFEYAVEDLIAGPVAEERRELLLAVDGLAYVAPQNLERWGYLMKRLSDRGLKLLVWGGQELHELCTRPASEGRFSAFHVLRPVQVGPLSAAEVQALVVERGADERAAAVLYEETSGHPALVRAMVEGYPEEVWAREREAFAARLLGSDPVARLRRAVEADVGAQEVLRDFAGVMGRLPRGRRAGEERLLWLGVLRDGGPMHWEWTSPVMQRFAAEW